MMTPSDPFTPAAENAAMVRELFESYTAVGFTEDQALSLVIVHMQEAMRSTQ